MSTNGYQRVSRREVYRGRIFSVIADELALPDGSVVERDWVDHKDSVVIAAVDDQDRVAMIYQYRQAVGRSLWELPAGMLDVEGEAPAQAAARELAEEADLAAGRWDLLVQTHVSPGFTNEQLHIFLARDLSDVPLAQRHVRHQEEAHIVVEMVPLADALERIFSGDITNGGAVAGVLAVAQARARGWAGLRSAQVDQRT